VSNHLLRERPELAKRGDRFRADAEAGVGGEASERTLACAEVRLAQEAVAARAEKQAHAPNHVITDCDFGDVGSDLLNHARALVTEDGRQQEWDVTISGVQVGMADSRRDGPNAHRSITK